MSGTATATKVRVIPAANRTFILEAGRPVFRKKRVAAYGRVSTDSDEQQESYEAQYNHYSKHIQQNPEWEFVDFYGDEAISGTSTKKRDGFNRMIKDALDGKIDYIITKAISRFARNTLDTLNNVRMLKERGIGVYFETQNIDTLDSKGEVLLTILAALAQDEIRCLSENVAWGKRSRYAEGKVFIPTKRFLGFEKDAEGNIIINEKEAATVRLIYKMFLEGKTAHYITKHLESTGILSPTGAETWYPRSVISILENEKYKGDALLQKKYVPDFLTKKVVKNDGVLPQFYVENSHPAIVSAEVWDMAQAEFKRRREKGRQLCGDNPLSGKIVCGECGGAFGSKQWHSNTKYQRTVWQCNEKYKTRGVKKCDLPHVNSDTITDAFISVFNEIYECRDEVLGNLETVISRALDEKKIRKTIEKLEMERGRLETEIKALITANATTPMNQDEYLKTYEELVSQYGQTEVDIQTQGETQQTQAARKGTAKAFIKALKKQTAVLTEFDEGLWHLLIDIVTVHAGRLVFRFKNEMEIERVIS